VPQWPAGGAVRLARRGPAQGSAAGHDRRQFAARGRRRTGGLRRLGDRRGMTDLILCATQRCGSTMIIEDMRNTGVLGEPEEWFVPWKAEKKDVDWRKALEQVRKRATGINGVMAIKVMANQLHDIDGCLSSVFKTPPRADFPRFHWAFRKAKWIRLTRRDVVEQAVSRAMSLQTGINHATASAEDPHFAGNLLKGYTSDYNAETVYKYPQILREVTAIVLENLAWGRFFAGHGITPVDFVYEDVVADEGMTHLDVMARLAGLTEPPPRMPRRMVKMANARNAEWRERFYRDAAQNRYRE
jgi:LPS sulfotransferase NodH